MACSASAEDLLSAPNTPEEVHKVHRHLSSSESSFINEEQQQCLGLCGVEYEDLLQAASVENASSDGKVLRILSFDTGDMDHMGRKKAAEMYFERTGVRVLFELVPDFLGTYDEIRSQLEGKLPLYDGFICGPAIVGTAVQLDGFLDLTSYTREHQELKWLDVLRGFRENIAVYDGRVRMFPLDGDAHFMYYREDVLEAFNLQVPRTWDEYWQVAKAVHGKTFKNQTMVGNCVGMMPNGHVAYWASLVLSSYTQTNGATQGFILDSKDLSPLMGEAMAETLKMLELQATFGHPDGKLARSLSHFAVSPASRLTHIVFILSTVYSIRNMRWGRTMLSEH